MTREKSYQVSKNTVRDFLNGTFENADEIKRYELELVRKLFEIDRQRLFVFCGHKSLMGFCNHGLKFSRTQSQRLTTLVRRYVPTANIGMKGPDVS